MFNRKRKKCPAELDVNNANIRIMLERLMELVNRCIYFSMTKQNRLYLLKKASIENQITDEKKYETVLRYHQDRAESQKILYHGYRDPYKTILQQIEYCLRHKSGDCKEYAALYFIFLHYLFTQLEKSHEIRFLQLVPGEHVFLALTTWKQELIIDPWANKILTGSEYQSFLKQQIDNQYVCNDSVFASLLSTKTVI